MTYDPLEHYMITRGGRNDRRLRLRVMTPSESLDATIRAYQTLGRALLKQSALPAFFCLTAALFISKFVIQPFFNTEAGASASQQISEILVRLALGFGVGIPLYLVSIAWISAISTTYISQWIVGQVPNEQLALKSAASVFPKVFLALFLNAIYAMLGVLLSLPFLIASSRMPATDGETASVTAGIGFFGLVLGFFFAAGWQTLHGLVAPIVASEGISTGKALKRSRLFLGKKSSAWISQSTMLRLGMVGILLIIGVAVTLRLAFGILGFDTHAQTFLAGTPYNWLFQLAPDILTGFCALWIVLPFWSVGLSIIYFEARVRVEGYDIDVLASDIREKKGMGRFEA